MSSKYDLQNDLQKIGLDHQEIAVYLSCLHNTKTTPSELSELVQIKRTSLYPILQKLLDKNLIYKKTFIKKKYIFAHPPEHAMKSVGEAARKQADNIEKTTEKLIKKLEANTEQLSYQTNSGALFLSGKPGMREFIQKVLDEKQDIYWIGPSKMFVGLDKNQQRELFQRLSVKRMDNGTVAFAITDKNFETSSYFHGGPNTFRQFRTIDLPQSLNAMIIVTGNLCGLVKSLENKSEVVIFEDSEYSEILRLTLKLLWQSLGK